MQKKFGATVLAMLIFASSALAEDVFTPGSHQKSKSFSDFLRSTWTYIVRML